MRTYYVIARSRTEILHIYPDEDEARRTSSRYRTSSATTTASWP